MEDFEDGNPHDFNASTWLQTWLLTQRILRNQWRNVPYMYSKIWVHVVSAILVGLTFFRLGTGVQDLQNRYFCPPLSFRIKLLFQLIYIQNRAFSVYFIVFLVNSIVNTILLRFFLARLYWEFREGPSRIYSWVALCSASWLAEMPGALVCAVVYYLLWYFPSGLPHGGTAAYVFLFTLTYEIFQVRLAKSGCEYNNANVTNPPQVLFGLFMMALSPDLGFAGNVLVFLVCTMNWYNGIIVPYNQIQVFWRYWVRIPLPCFPFLISHVPPIPPFLPENLAENNPKILTSSSHIDTALLPQPLHLPPRRNGNRRNRKPTRRLRPLRPQNLLAPARANMRILRRRMGH